MERARDAVPLPPLAYPILRPRLCVKRAGFAPFYLQIPVKLIREGMPHRAFHFALVSAGKPYFVANFLEGCPPDLEQENRPCLKQR